MKYEEEIKRINELRNQYSDLRLEFWLEHDLFKPYWWFLLVSSLLPWLIWWRLADKSRFKELFIYGLFWGVIASVLDEFGVALKFWYYPRKLFSMVSPLFPADLTVIPITFMFVYQYFPKGKGFFWGNFFASAVLSFVAQPLFIYFDFFRAVNWEHIYSFPAFILLAYFIKWISTKVEKQAAMNT